MYKFVVDMMGGDLGPNPLIEAIKQFLSLRDDVNFVCVGKIEELSDLKDNSRVELVDARDVIKMDEDPFHAIKASESSMIKGFNLVKENGYDAIISCGGTGAYLTGATLLLGRINGVRRPCFVAPFPSVVKGKFTVLLDVGANNKNTVEEMVQFAQIGRLYSQIVFDVKAPKIYLLSNGTEDHKGSPLVADTNKALRDMNLEGFKGNMEARDVLSGEADVVVCDGYTGNVLLKSTEGSLKVISELIKKGFKKNILTIIGYLFSKSVVKNIKDTFNYKSVGGAMLLGVKGVVVKAHGNSDVESCIGAFNVAYKLVKNKVNESIENEINKKESI
jgi:glycerol-3-phosphate acyltransferase PlsX